MHPEPPQKPPEEIAEIFRGELTRSQRFGVFWRSLWFVEVWTEYRELFKSFALDFGFSALLAGGLEVFHYWSTKSSSLETQAFVRIHYIATVAAFLIFGISFAIDIIILQLSRWRKK
jgi:hypothetical protein